jgi:hypothetical protein
MRLKICVSDMPDLVTGKQPSQIICYKRQILWTPVCDNLGYRQLPTVSVMKSQRQVSFIKRLRTCRMTTGVPRLSCKYNTDVFTTVSGNKGHRRLAKLTTVSIMKQPSTGYDYKPSQFLYKCNGRTPVSVIHILHTATQPSLVVTSNPSQKKCAKTKKTHFLNRRLKLVDVSHTLVV